MMKRPFHVVPASSRWAPKRPAMSEEPKDTTVGGDARLLEVDNVVICAGQAVVAAVDRMADAIALARVEEHHVVRVAERLVVEQRGEVEPQVLGVIGKRVALLKWLDQFTTASLGEQR